MFGSYTEYRIFVKEITTELFAKTKYYENLFNYQKSKRFRNKSS